MASVTTMQGRAAVQMRWRGDGTGSGFIAAWDEAGGSSGGGANGGRAIARPEAATTDYAWQRAHA